MRTIWRASSSETSGVPWAMSKPHTISHSFHGLTMRTRPAPMPPTFAPGESTQYSAEGRCPTSRERSAVKVMFMDPAMSICPSSGRPMSAATCERAPSAPIRYLERMVCSVPVTRLSTLVVTPSSSWTWETYCTANCICVPRRVAWLTMIGSSRVCGMSQFSSGEASS